MSSCRRKGKGKCSEKSLGDVTINDFANSSVCKSRSKKSNTSVNHVVKKLVEIDERSWDEKLDDFDGDFDLVREENEDGTSNVLLKKLSGCPSSRRKKRTYIKLDPMRNSGNEYPLDIWFLISEYIRPEDVGRFAGICRSTFEVVCSAKFWFRLYKRYYKSVPNLPERLQPECMVRLYSLRPCVIRALYFMYPPFINRLKSVTTFHCNPHKLKKCQCVLMWHQKYKNKWNFYFKLKEPDWVSYDRSPKQQPDLIEMLEDVFANQDKNCRILQVTCLNYVSAPLVLGLSLASVSLTLSQGCRYHRLQLTFSSSVCSSSNMPLDANNSCVIVLDPVINIRILDWWHPQYPHSGTPAAYLINQE